MNGFLFKVSLFQLKTVSNLFNIVLMLHFRTILFISKDIKGNQLESRIFFSFQFSMGEIRPYCTLILTSSTTFGVKSLPYWFKILLPNTTTPLHSQCLIKSRMLCRKHWDQGRISHGKPSQSV